MVYKRYIKRKVNGKIKTFGPYYYESHKDKDGNVVSKYISGPKRSKRIRSVTVKKQPRKFSKKYLFLSLVIGIVILLSAGLFVLNQKTSLTSKSLVPNISSGEAGFSRKIEQSKENFVVSSARKVYSFLTGFVTEEAAPEAPPTEEPAPEPEPTPESEAAPESSTEEAPPKETPTETSSETTSDTSTEELTEETSAEEESSRDDSTEPPAEETISEESTGEVPTETPVEEPVSPRDTQKGHENLSPRGDSSKDNSAEPSAEPNETTQGNETEANITIMNETTETNITAVNETNVTIEANITGQNITIVNETPVNETVINITSVGDMTINTIQYNAILGKPVKWKKEIKTNKSSSNLTIEIPKQAENITVYKIIRGEKEELAENTTIINETAEEPAINESEEVIEEVINETGIVTNETIEKQVINKSEKAKEGKEKKSKKTKIKVTAQVISGKISAEIDLGEAEEKSLIAGFFKRIFSKITGRAIDVQETTEIKQVVIEENATEFEIEYETPGPVSFEKTTESKKNITISSEFHYKNVLAFTELPKEVSNPKLVKLYHIVNGSKLLTNFEAYDTNNNSLIDYIEWVVPHLSNQTYELEIIILNVQSYPTVGGNWTVRFTTNGMANLTISAVEGTTWSNNDNYEDLKFLQIKCSGEVLGYEWINDSVFVEDYSCNGTSYEISKVLTTGKHVLEFNFGGQKAQARNSASGPIPQTINLHGKLTNSTGSAVNGTFNMTFRIYDAATSGTKLWESANNSVIVDSNGVYSHILSPVNISFKGDYYLGVQINNESEMTPLINLTSTPYSYRANITDNLDSTSNYQVANFSADYFFGNGSQLTDVCLSNGTGCLSSDTQKGTSGKYVYNDSANIMFNETQLNSTIDNRDSDTIYTAGDGIIITGTEINSTLGTSVESSEITDGTIADADISDITNLTLGEKITFTLGGILDNIVNGWLRITGNLNVTGNTTSDWGTFTNLNVTGTSYLGSLILGADNITVNNILNRSNDEVKVWSNLNIANSLFADIIGSSTDKITKGWFADLDVSGNLTDGTNNASVLEMQTAYDHSQNNSQAHSDYLLNTGDTGTGDYVLDGAVTINEAGADKDFRVEGVGAPNALFIDGTNGRIGIGTNTPTSLFHIFSPVDGYMTFEDAGNGVKYDMGSLGGYMRLKDSIGGTTFIRFAGTVSLDFNADTSIKFNTNKNDRDTIFYGDLAEIARFDAGTESLDFDDNQQVKFGTGGDAKIYYNGTDLIIDPNVVGTGKVLIGATGNDVLESGNITINKLLKLTAITLPTCAEAGLIARNTTTIYFCNSTDWRQFNFVN